MQVLPQSQIAPRDNSNFYSYAEMRESFQFAQENTSIQFASDTGDTFTLSQTSTYISMDSTYTAEGLTINNGENSGAPAVSSENKAVETNSLENADLYYLDLIKTKVEYLLKSISEMISGNPPPDRPILKSPNSTESVISNIAYFQNTTHLSNASPPGLDSLDFSAESTAKRIVDFALSFYTGGDRQEYAEMVRGAVMKGFQEAQMAFGGFLPEISHQTINLVNSALDEFAAGGTISISA
ncbi:MAG: hypothetical protein HOC71_18215 [Candidatus Latescibacteria bacterium]|jgi:hypothetical protein|nr:hypothetical protein [Candidatus Latescibacterota bacterium]